MFSLRHYQKEIINSVHKEFADGNRSVCVQMPTGSGKTICAGAIAYLTLKKQSKSQWNKILFLVHRTELANQAYDTLCEFGLEDELARISPHHAIRIWAPIQIASIQTVSRRIKSLDWLKPSLIFVDEAHHCRAATWERVIKCFPSSRIVGLTATPSRLDGKGLGELFDVLIEGPSMKQLIDEGSLCDIDIYSVSSGLSVDGIKKTGGDFNKKELDDRVSGPVIASTINNWFKIAKDRRTLNYSVSIRHSKEVVKQIKQLGISAEHVDGTTHEAEREAIFRRFSDGVTQFVSNVDIVTEGFDCPECDCVIIKPTASLTLYLQMIGRVMRPKKDGRKGLVLDVGGNVTYKDHGDPRDEVHWSLDEGLIINQTKAVKRMSRPCKNCGFLFPYTKTECPICGREVTHRMPREVDVELTKLKEVRQVKRSNREMALSIMGSMGDDEELNAIAIKYGYKLTEVSKWKEQYKLYWDAKRVGSHV